MKDTLGRPLLSFVRRLSSLGGSTCIGTSKRNTHAGPQVVSFINRLSLFPSVCRQKFHCMYIRERVLYSAKFSRR